MLAAVRPADRPGKDVGQVPGAIEAVGDARVHHLGSAFRQLFGQQRQGTRVGHQLGAAIASAVLERIDQRTLRGDHLDQRRGGGVSLVIEKRRVDEGGKRQLLRGFSRGVDLHFVLGA
ncbi:MAG: hypothetical protein IPJ65_05520 [Archangiaceae bacterium]|nr:hypothetical protein [Archangiaceae bacterium]